MTPSAIAEHFEREQGCSESDWLRCLPGAADGRPLLLAAPGAARVTLGTGTLDLHWTVLPPRQIALVRLPRMQVRFRFSGVAAAERLRFMRHFDLFLQRGGG